MIRDMTTLPLWAEPVPGESRESWISATFAKLPIDARMWTKWLRPDSSEPERPASGEWVGFPEALADIRSVPPTWRLAARWRRVRCPACSVGGPQDTRWPTLVEWLDARRIYCRSHGRLLIYGRPQDFLDHPDPLLEGVKQAEKLCEWLDDWIAIEGRSSPSLQAMECLWRRDLVTLVMRNWGVLPDYGGCISAPCDVPFAPWRTATHNIRFATNAPTRVGLMPPNQRVSALWCAYLCWCSIGGEGAPPVVAPDGWRWLARRWSGRTSVSDVEAMTRFSCNVPKAGAMRQRNPTWWRRPVRLA